MGAITARISVDNWRSQVRDLFKDMSHIAEQDGWTAIDSSAPASEDPFGMGARINFDAPVLTLKRIPHHGHEERITFEPQQRYSMDAAGRIDVYSYPRMREAMLLRVPDLSDASSLTWEDAEQRVANTPWQAFSQDRLPLDVDLSDDASVRKFLENLVV